MESTLPQCRHLGGSKTKAENSSSATTRFHPNQSVRTCVSNVPSPAGDEAIVGRWNWMCE